MAEGSGSIKKKFKKFWRRYLRQILVVSILSVAAVVFSTCIHELGHVLATWLTGGETSAIKVFFDHGYMTNAGGNAYFISLSGGLFEILIGCQFIIFARLLKSGISKFYSYLLAFYCLSCSAINYLLGWYNNWGDYLGFDDGTFFDYFILTLSYLSLLGAAVLLYWIYQNYNKTYSGLKLKTNTINLAVGILLPMTIFTIFSFIVERKDSITSILLSPIAAHIILAIIFYCIYRRQRKNKITYRDVEELHPGKPYLQRVLKRKKVFLIKSITTGGLVLIFIIATGYLRIDKDREEYDYFKALERMERKGDGESAFELGMKYYFGEIEKVYNFNNNGNQYQKEWVSENFNYQSRGLYYLEKAHELGFPYVAMILSGIKNNSIYLKDVQKNYHNYLNSKRATTYWLEYTDILPASFGDYQKSKEIINELSKRQPDECWYKLRVINLKIILGEDVKEDCQKIIDTEHDPKNSLLLYAKFYLDKISEEDLRNDALNILCINFQEGDEIDEESKDMLLRFDSEHFFQRGLKALMNKDKDKAVKYFKKSVSTKKIYNFGWQLSWLILTREFPGELTKDNWLASQ